MKTFLKISLFVALIAIIVFACKKDRDDSPTPSTPSTTVTVPITGTVLDEQGNPLSDVTVKAGTYTVTTDYYGTFYIPQPTFNISRFTISFEKPGYFTLYRSGVPQAGKPINLSIGMISESSPTYAVQKTFSSAQADSVELTNGSVVSFPANAFITESGSVYNGNVTVKACYIDPTWDNYGMFVFGGDLYGIDANNNDVMLNPFMGLNVVLLDQSGNKLQLDSLHNVKATVKMQIPPALVADAPSTIETWEYASSQGVKHEKGNASKVGDKYMGQVAHFSYWSCEKPHTGKATVWGYVKKVINSDSVGVSGVKVRVGRQLVVTDQDGKYEAKVPDNLNGIVVVPIFGSIAFNPQTITPALQNNESKRLDFVFSPSNVVLIRGVVKSASGIPIANALVSAEWYSTSSQKVVTFTNSLGRFALPVDATAQSVTLIAKAGTQSKSIYLYNLTNDVDTVITMPAIPGNNKLLVNGTTIFNFTGNPTGVNDEVFGYFIQQNIDVYVHIDGSGMFQIMSNSGLTTPVVGTSYSIPNDFTVQYGTQQLTYPDTLTNGTIQFTKLNTTGGLIEGTVSGTSSYTQNTVTINFSVPNNATKSDLFKRKRK